MFLNLIYKLFLVGLFFLPTTLFVALLFLLPPIFHGFWLIRKDYFSNKWNIAFLLCGVVILINSLLQRFIVPIFLEGVWDPNLTFIGLMNWIPFFLIFPSFQPYLNSSKLRRNAALAILTGSIPVVIVSLGHHFFKWEGPLEIFNGLIIWFLKPVMERGGVGGIFSNQNYAGSWLVFVWPFCIALLLDKTKNLLKKTFSISFLISLATAAFLTNSRSAWGGILISMPIVIGYQSFLWFLPLLICMFFVLLICISDIFSGPLQDFIRQRLSDKVWLEFSKEGFSELEVSRLGIFIKALEIIKSKPLLGIGAGAFPFFITLETNFWKGHSHNLFTELAISYGLPVAIIFCLTVSLILFKSGKIIFYPQDKNVKFDYFERAWWSSIFIFLISQLVDIQYFEGRISLMFWILLAGLKSIISENASSNYQNL